MILIKRIHLLVNRLINFYIIRQTYISQLDINNEFVSFLASLDLYRKHLD